MPIRRILSIMVFFLNLKTTHATSFQAHQSFESCQKMKSYRQCSTMILYYLMALVAQTSFCFGHFSTIPPQSLLYSHIKDNPYLDQHMQAKIEPYLLPHNHPYKAAIDLIFSASRVSSTKETLVQAGFEIIAHMEGRSYVIVARHPAVPGYVFKIYPDSETRVRTDKPHYVLLLERCIGAAHIRHTIAKKQIRHFTVPDKWLYVLPHYPLSTEANSQPVILIATDMELTDPATSDRAWLNVGREELRELYAILKEGYGSVRVGGNIPYTKNGTFAFTDTEHMKRDLDLKIVNKYISKEMQPYWNKLIK